MKAYRVGPETSRLRLQAMTPHDAAAFYALCSDPRVMQYTGEVPCESEAAAAAALAAYPDFDSVGYGRWGCYLKESGALIGFCGLKYLADRGLTDVGYRLMPDYWGRGLATEACEATLAFGLEQLQLPEIWAFVLPANIASRRVLEKVGMRRREDGSEDGEAVWQFSLSLPEYARAAE